MHSLIDIQFNFIYLFVEDEKEGGVLSDEDKQPEEFSVPENVVSAQDKELIINVSVQWLKYPGFANFISCLKWIYWCVGINVGVFSRVISLASSLSLLLLEFHHILIKICIFFYE